MLLTFDRNHVERLLADSEAAEKRRPTFEQAAENVPAGLWLVGDQGVYIMSNASPVGEKADVAYAHQVDPTTLPFDDWWQAKRASFGGDDGVEFVEADTVRRWFGGTQGDTLTLELDAVTMEFIDDTPA